MRKKQAGWRLAAGAVLTTCMLLGPVEGVFAADKDVQMQVVVGFDSAFRETALTQVSVTVENKGGDFTGRLVVKPKYDNNGSFVRGQFVRDVVLPKASTKTVTIDVPGGLFREAADVRLLDANGNEVDSKTPNVSNVNDSMLLGGISLNKDDLNLFALVNTPAVGGKVIVRQLQPGDLSDHAAVYNGLDLLVVNHAPKESLTKEQIQAIHDWVKDGGHLLLSGGPNYNGGASLFSDLSPVQVTGTGDATDLTTLQQYAGSKPSVSKLNVSTGTLVPGAQAIITAGHVPLLAERHVGAGQVLYAAYDLSEEPLASWQGNKDLWGRVFSGVNFSIQGIKQTQQNGGPTGVDQKRGIVSASASFNNLLPSYVSNLAVFGFYLLVIGPLLYFVLRRMKKQGLNWVLIPVVSIVFALGVYLVGSNSRSGGAISQFVSVINLQTEQNAKVDGAAAIVVTHGGDYTVKLPKGTYGFPANDYGPTSTGESLTYVGDDEQHIEFNNVEYWTLRTASLESTLHDAGLVKSDLHVNKEGKLVGTLVNNTKFDLQSVFLLIGNEPIKVENMKKGGTLKIDQQLSKKNLGLGNPNSLIDKMFPMPINGYGPEDLDLQQNRTLADYVTQPWNLSSATVQLLAFTHEPLNLYSINNVNMSEASSTSLIRQDLALTYDESGSTIPPGYIRPQVTKQEGNVYSAPDGMHLMIGSVTIEYDLKMNVKFKTDKVTTNLDSAGYAMFDKQLFNYKTGEWDNVSKENTPTLSGELMKTYVGPDSILKIKLKSASATDNYMPFPNVGLEGKGNS